MPASMLKRAGPRSPLNGDRYLFHPDTRAVQAERPVDRHKEGNGVHNPCDGQWRPERDRGQNHRQDSGEQLALRVTA